MAQMGLEEAAGSTFHVLPEKLTRDPETGGEQTAWRDASG